MSAAPKYELEPESAVSRRTLNEAIIDAREQGKADAEFMIRTIRETLLAKCSSYCLDNEVEVALVTREIAMALLNARWRMR